MGGHSFKSGYQRQHTRGSCGAHAGSEVTQAKVTEGKATRSKLTETSKIRVQYASLVFMLMMALTPLTAFAALSIDRATLHQYEDGPILPASHIFLPGETVFFSCRLAGYQALVDPKDEQRSVKLSWQLKVTDPTGTLLVPAAAGNIVEPVSSQDKSWLPKFSREFVVPAFAPPGTYHVNIVAADDVAKSQLPLQVDFQVRGHPVETSSALTARNLHFLKSEKDGPPLEPAAYHPGETLWARFDITGYGFAEKNRFSVEYGLAVLRESGAQVFAQPAAASDSNEAFYPQRYVPGALSLTLNPDVPPGTYFLVITMEDKVSGQKAETRGAFHIER